MYLVLSTYTGMYISYTLHWFFFFVFSLFIRIRSSLSFCLAQRLCIIDSIYYYKQLLWWNIIDIRLKSCKGLTAIKLLSTSLNSYFKKKTANRNIVSNKYSVLIGQYWSNNTKLYSTVLCSYCCIALFANRYLAYLRIVFFLYFFFLKMVRKILVFLFVLKDSIYHVNKHLLIALIFW